MKAKDQIHAAVREVNELRQLAHSQPTLLKALSEVKQLQSRRFAGTYSDFVHKAPYRRAVEFFLSELYADKDYSQRDEQFSRISAGLEHFFPSPLLAAAVSLAQLHSLTERLDLEMAQLWLSDPATDEAVRYLRAWRLLNHRSDRLRQLMQVMELGRLLENITHTPGLQLVLRMMRGPASLAEKGYDRFSTGDVSDYADVTRTAFYNYFPSKQALVLELLEDFLSFLRLSLRPSRKGKDPADSVLQVNLAYVRFFSVNAWVILSIQHLRRTLSGAERQHFDLNDWWARKVAQVIMQSGGGQNGKHSRLALATAYALEAMVDGFLTELYVRKNPNLVALDLTEAEVAKVVSDVWSGATAKR